MTMWWLVNDEAFPKLLSMSRGNVEERVDNYVF